MNILFCFSKRFINKPEKIERIHAKKTMEIKPFRDSSYYCSRLALVFQYFGQKDCCRATAEYQDLG